jgi:RNA polymerase sigma-70 factor (ECF subfamily)
VETSNSLLVRARNGDETAWERLAHLYRPLIVGWLRRHGVVHHDAEDLTQDILLSVARHLSDFMPSGRQGAFRCWLRTITVNRTRDFWKARSHRLPNVEAAGVEEFTRQLEDPESALSREWDQEHDRYVVQRLLEMMEQTFEAVTVRAFRRLVLEGASADQVADELGMSKGAVYVAKSRVLQRLRQEAEGLLDD